MRVLQARRAVAITAAAGLAGWLLLAHPPVRTVGSGETGVRTNLLTGSVVQWRDGSILVLPGLHQVQVFSLRDRNYRPAQLARAAGAAPVQSVEGLAVGIDLALRYALDPARIAATARNLPPDIDAEIVEPAVQNVAYKVFARYTVREIFSTKRLEIQQTLEADLKQRLAADGVLLKSVIVGKVDLPADYRRGMDGLLAEAEAFRMEKIGEANAQQMAREGSLLSRHPLLIQKTLADKLSDKVQVIIAPPGAAGGFLGANLLGTPSGREAGPQHAAVKGEED